MMVLISITLFVAALAVAPALAMPLGLEDSVSLDARAPKGRAGRLGRTLGRLAGQGGSSYVQAKAESLGSARAFDDDDLLDLTARGRASKKGKGRKGVRGSKLGAGSEPAAAERAFDDDDLLDLAARGRAPRMGKGRKGGRGSGGGGYGASAPLERAFDDELIDLSARRRRPGSMGSGPRPQRPGNGDSDGATTRDLDDDALLTLAARELLSELEEMAARYSEVDELD